jgi:DNA-binding GntR family transcriptional regulator
MSITAQESVLAELRRQITSGQLSAGQQIVQDALATQLGVSRVPLREALKVLEGEGHVVYHPHRGYFVTELSVDDLVEVYRIRELLEAEALRSAVSQLDVTDMREIEEISREIARASERGDVAAVSSANRQFHFAIFEASGMPRLVRMIRTLWDATDAYRGVYMAEPENLARMQSEHTQMIDALRTGDVEAVIRLHVEHRDNTVAAVSRIIRRR